MLNLHDIQCIRSGDLLAPVSFGGGGGTRTRQNTIRPPTRTDNQIDDNEILDCVTSGAVTAVSLTATGALGAGIIIGDAQTGACAIASARD